jgi:hypothetical protein
MIKHERKEVTWDEAALGFRMEGFYTNDFLSG